MIYIIYTACHYVIQCNTERGDSVATKLRTVRMSEQTEAELQRIAKCLDRSQNWVTVSILESALEKGQVPEYLLPHPSESDASASHVHPVAAPAQPASAS